MSKSNTYWMYGKHPVLAALQNPERKCYELLITSACKQSIAEECNFLDKNLACSIRIVDSKELDKVIKNKDVPHQGIALKVAPLESKKLKDILKNVKSAKSTILVLDNLTDPQNVGAIIRSSVAFGVDAVVIPKNNSSIESAALTKAAVGNYEKMPLCIETNLNNVFRTLREQGYWVLGLDGAAKENISCARNYDKVVLVLGSEGEGMRKLTRENCDLLLKIPIRNAESLNVSNAAAVALYEVAANE